MNADLKTTYTIPELAEMLSMTRNQVWHMLRRDNVPVRRLGRKILVGLQAFRDTYPDLWGSILLRVGMEEGDRA
jgi:hypothetical protein